MSALVLTRSQLDDVIRHCLRGRPNEACGLFAAVDGRVIEVFPMSNAAKSPVRYSLDSKEQFRVYRLLDERGWELGGVFHSHTRTDAYPSPTDIRLATEDVPYVIVSLVQDPPETRAFRIRKANFTDEEGEVTEIEVRVQDE